MLALRGLRGSLSIVFATTVLSAFVFGLRAVLPPETDVFVEDVRRSLPGGEDAAGHLSRVLH